MKPAMRLRIADLMLLQSRDERRETMQGLREGAAGSSSSSMASSGGGGIAVSCRQREVKRREEEPGDAPAKGNGQREC